MRLDLPTFDRPIKAYSGSGLRGQLATSGLDITNDAFMYLSLRVFNFARFVLFSHPKDEAEKAREGGEGGCGVAYPPIGRGKVEAFGRKEDITTDTIVINTAGSKAMRKPQDSLLLCLYKNTAPAHKVKAARVWFVQEK